MFPFLLLGFLPYPFLVSAGVYTVPVQPNIEAVSQLLAHYELDGSRSDDEGSASGRLQRRGQSPLSVDADHSESGRHRVEIWDGSLNPYIVPGAVGNPPQPFRLLLDLAWDTLFVPSMDCTGDCEDFNPKLPFYSNRSATYSVLEDYAEMVYGTDRFWGELATDSFRIAGIELENQSFINVDSANPLGFISFYFGYDGVLGLAPRFNHLHSTDLTSAPSPWFNMVNQSLLDANLFALELPDGIEHWQDVNRWGEISFGGISPKYEPADFSRLPISAYSDQVWAVEARFLTWENETHPLHEDFVNLTLAGFDTTSWFIGLPGDWAEKIYASVDNQCGGFTLNCEIDCLQREKMPNFTFGLAGKNFTITPYDYVVEVEGPAKMKYCFFELIPTEGHYPVNAIVLGKPFMEAFYSVFDLDEMEVRLTKRL